MLSRASLLLAVPLLALLSTSSGCERASVPPELIVVVDADSALRRELEAVEVQTKAGLHVVARTDGTKHLAFPLSFTLVSSTKQAAPVSVRGLRSEAVVVEHTADVTAVGNQRSAWYVFLSSACPAHCPPNQSCNACGQCAPIDLAPVESLHGAENPLTHFSPPVCDHETNGTDAGMDAGHAGQVDASTRAHDAGATVRDAGSLTEAGANADAQAVRADDAATADAGALLTAVGINWQCVSGACPWGTSGSNYGVAWPSSLGPQPNRLVYHNSAPIYLPAARARRITITIVSGTAGVYAGTDSAESGGELVQLSAGDSYVITDSNDADLVSVQGVSPFTYRLDIPGTADSGF